MSWSFDYAVKMVKKLERYEPRWIKEPFMSDDIDSYVRLRKKTEISIAGASMNTLGGCKGSSRAWGSRHIANECILGGRYN